MILTPKAKPVRIRIKSGGIEHSSINSLREHFDFNDIFPLCQNDSMLRWLEQQNETIVYDRLKIALSGKKNSEENYFFNIILAFFPDAYDSGIKDFKELLQYWSQRKNYSICKTVIEIIQDKDVLKSLLESTNDIIYTNLYKKRLGYLYLDSGDLVESSSMGNKDALKTLKDSLPSYASNFSAEDVKSFLSLKEDLTKKLKISSACYTTAVKNCALLISLIQDIISNSDDAAKLTSFLARDGRISKKDWPRYLQPYIKYIMYAVRAYIGKGEITHWGMIISYYYESRGRFYVDDNKKLSFAEGIILSDSNKIPSNIIGVNTLSISYLQKIRPFYEEYFLMAINSIKQEILGN